MKPLQYVFYQENVLPIPGPTHDIMNKSEAILSTIITDNRPRKMEAHEMKKLIPLIKGWKIFVIRISNYCLI